MKSSRKRNIDKLTSKLGLVKKSVFVPGVTSSGMGHTDPSASSKSSDSPYDRKPLQYYDFEEISGLKLPKYTMYYDENLNIAYLLDSQNNIVTLDDIANHPAFDPLKHLAPGKTSAKELDPATRKKLGKIWEDLRKSNREIDIQHYDDYKETEVDEYGLPKSHKDPFYELKHRYLKQYGAPLHSDLANKKHKLKEGAIPYIIGGDVISKLPVDEKTGKRVVTPLALLQALVQLGTLGDAISHTNKDFIFNTYYDPQSTYKYHKAGTLRYAKQLFYNPETGKFDTQDLSDDDWTTGWDWTFNEEEAAKLYKPKDHFVPIYQLMLAMSMAKDKTTEDPFYEYGNLGHVLAREDGISRLGGIEDYVDLATYKDAHLKQLEEALGDKKAFHTAMDYVEYNNALDEWFRTNEIGAYGKINPLTGLYEGKPLPYEAAISMPRMPDGFLGNAKAKIIYDFVLKNAEDYKRRHKGKALPDLLAGRTKSMSSYDENGNLIPFKLTRLSSIMNEGNDNPVFIDHLGREFSKKPKYAPDFTWLANQLLGTRVHDDDGPYDLQRGFFSKNPLYAKYNPDNPIVALYLSKIADSGRAMRRNGENDRYLLAGLLGQDVADFERDLWKTNTGASYVNTALLLNMGFALNGQTYRLNNYDGKTYALDSTSTNRTFTSAMTQNPVSLFIQGVPAYAIGGVGYVLGGGGLFGDAPADYMYNLGHGLGGMVGTVINPMQWAYGYVNTATGNAYNTWGLALHNEFMQDRINDQLLKGFEDYGYTTFDKDDYYNVSNLGHIGNAMAGDQTSMFTNDITLDIMGGIEQYGAFLPFAGKAISTVAGRGLSATGRIAPMVLLAVGKGDDVLRLGNTIDDIVLTAGSGKLQMAFRQAADQLGLTYPELYSQLGSKSTYIKLFGEDGLTHLNPKATLNYIRNMYNGYAPVVWPVAIADAGTLGGVIPNTYLGLTNPKLYFSHLGAINKQRQWASNWGHLFNGTQPKAWYLLDMTRHNLLPFLLADESQYAFGRFHPNNILWDRRSGNQSIYGNILYDHLSPQRSAGPVRLFLDSKDVIPPVKQSYIADTQLDTVEDYAPEVISGDQLSPRVTNPDAVSSLNPRTDLDLDKKTDKGNFPWLALGLGAGAAGLGIYLYNKQKEEEDKKRKRQQMV